LGVDSKDWVRITGALLGEAAAARSGQRDLARIRQRLERPAFLLERGVGRVTLLRCRVSQCAALTGPHERPRVSRPGLIDGDGFGVCDDVNDRLEDLLLRHVHAEDQRSAHDTPGSEMRAVPAVVHLAIDLDPPNFKHVRVRPAARDREWCRRILELDCGLQVGVPGHR